MPAEPSPEPLPSGTSEAVAFALGAAPARGEPLLTERELNSPSPLALRLLGVVFLATFLPWAAAKLACNVRVAPLRQPPELSLEVLSRQPKGAALELQQRVASGRYREAAELAKGDVARELLEAEARCQSDPAPCEALRARAGEVATRAVLVGRGAQSAEARAESQVGGQVERFVLRLEVDAGRWYVVSRQPYPGDLTTPVPVISLNPAPAPGAAPPPATTPAPGGANASLTGSSSGPGKPAAQQTQGR